MDSIILSLEMAYVNHILYREKEREIQHEPLKIQALNTIETDGYDK